MLRNIILCSDGTGNTFDSHTNVRGLVECLALDDCSRQVVVYHQGVGTAESSSQEFAAYKKSVGNPKALMVPESSTRFWPMAQFDRLRGLLSGYGLKENVCRMYQKLSELYRGDDDRVFLFGFSRGAFTVRALAGLLYRCGLPPEDNGHDFSARVEQAWELYEPIEEDLERTREFRKSQRQCCIHFLGVWDTVKSYGVRDPVRLPHLRHNPIVKHVRHALALHERRAFFQHTTWGLLDSDEKGAMKRIRRIKPQVDLDLLEKQRKNIKEVWFAGSHSDIGGGKGYNSTIALRWMLGEAVNVADPALLNCVGKTLLKKKDAPPQTHESQNLLYRTLEKFPRKEIDNSGESPIKKDVSGSTGERDPDQAKRGGDVFFHVSVGDMYPLKRVPCQTKPLPAESVSGRVQGRSESR